MTKQADLCPISAILSSTSGPREPLCRDIYHGNKSHGTMHVGKHKVRKRQESNVGKGCVRERGRGQEWEGKRGSLLCCSRRTAHHAPLLTFPCRTLAGTVAASFAGRERRELGGRERKPQGGPTLCHTHHEQPLLIMTLLMTQLI